MNNTKIVALLIEAQKNPTSANKKAFVSHCYELYFTKLFLMARGLSRDLAEAEDKLQDFFMEKLLLSDCIAAFPTTELGIAAFITVVFRNYMRTKWRKEKRYLETHQMVDEVAWKKLEEEKNEDGFFNWEGQLQKYSKQLNANYQNILQLKMERRSNQEIASITGQTLNGVKSSFHRIKNQLKEIALSQKEEFGLLQRA